MEIMYYKTLKTSDTGVKFQKLQTKLEDVREARSDLLKTFDCPGKFTISFGVLDGGIQGIVLNGVPDPKIWKRDKNFHEAVYYPKLNSKMGKAIQKQFDDLPKVKRHELNMCIGWNESLSCIGFVSSNDRYFGFDTPTDNSIKIPNDCEEITSKEWKNLFPPKP